MPEPGEAETRPRVFVSYARDSLEHGDAVRDFATFLRVETGIKAEITEWFQRQRQDEVATVLKHINKADFIVAVASPAYKRALDNASSAKPGDLTAVQGALIRNILARSQEEELRRILPVVLPGGKTEDIPEVLRPYATTTFEIPEISLTGLRNLLHNITGSPAHPLPPLGPYFPPLPPAESIVVATSVSPPTPDGVLTAGAEVTIGGNAYLIQGDPEREAVADHAAVRSQGKALRLGPPHKHVWLRQVALRHDTPAAKDEIAALRHQRDLLLRLTERDPSFPKLVQFVDDSRVSTLVTAWATGTRGDPSGTLADFLPHPGDPVDYCHAQAQLRALAGIARTLSVLHATQHIHGQLTPEGVLRLDDRTFALRDLGDAGHGDRPGAAPRQYRAPEQELRHRGRTGPWTDVFQLAAIAYHLVTGHVPARGTPLPVLHLAPRISPGAAGAIESALALEAARRPGMDEFAAALRG